MAGSEYNFGSESVAQLQLGQRDLRGPTLLLIWQRADRLQKVLHHPDKMSHPIPLDDHATELLDIIVSHVPYSDQFSLCRVSKVLCAVCYRQLYGRGLGCMSPRTTVKLCRTLCRNKYAASVVRSITFGPSISAKGGTRSAIYQSLGQSLTFCLCRCFLKSLYDLIHNTLQCIPNLELLGLYLFDFDSSAILDNCIFPRIRTLRSHQPIDGSLASFLQRHPTLDRIELTNVPPLYPQLFVDIPLSALTDFYGPCDLLPMFQKGHSIRSATILWLAGAQIQDPPRLLPYFTSSSYRLNYNHPDWSLELASAITQYIPDVSTLKMREYLPKLEDESTVPITVHAQNTVRFCPVVINAIRL
jgi:hypothetical protein